MAIRAVERSTAQCIEPGRSWWHRTPDGDGWHLRLEGIAHPSINEWTRWHFLRVREEQKTWAKIVLGLRRTAPPVAGPLLVRVVYSFPSNREHDPDNYTPKFLLDAMVTAGLLCGDSDKSLRRLSIECNSNAKSKRTDVYVTPLAASEMSDLLEAQGR